MKIIINAFEPENTIANMTFGTSGYSVFQNVFITRKNVFVCLDIGVFKSPQEILEYYGEEADYFFVERKSNGGYSFNFGEIFSELAYCLYPDTYNELLGESDSFIALKNECIEIHDLKSKAIHFSEEELTKGLKELGSLIKPSSSLNAQQLHEELKKAVSREDYERAAKIRNELEKYK